MRRVVKLAQDLVIEKVGNELLIVVPSRAGVVRLSGSLAEFVLALSAGRNPDADESTVIQLTELGIVTAPGLSRRGLLKAGAIGAGASMAVMTMPSVAAASSEAMPAGVWWWEAGFGDQWLWHFGFYGGTDPMASSATRGLGTRLEGFFPVSGSPSVLTVPVTGSPATVQFDNGSADFGGVRWQIATGAPFTGPLPTNSEEDIIGTFDWEGPREFRFVFQTYAP